MSTEPEPDIRPEPRDTDGVASMRLRAERPRATRLSRKVLAGGAAIGLVAISGAVLWALQNNRTRSTAPAELYTTDHHNVADGLTGLPRDYAGTPRQAPPLGPALPGDLGRPILNAQNAPSAGIPAIDSEQQRLGQEIEAARLSKLFASTSIRELASSIAQVGSVGASTRLIGVYDSQVAFGQSRVLLVWTRLIMPNGRSIVLERQPGADTAGYSGLEDQVDNHWGALFKAALLSTLLSVGSELGSTIGAGSNGDVITALRRGSSDSLNQTGQKVVQQNLNVQPTLTIRPGFPLRVIVNRDLLLEPYRG